MQQQRPEISSFVRPHPPIVQNLKLTGLRLTKGTTIHVAICEDGGTRHAGILLNKENAETKTVEARLLVILSGEIFLDQLPETVVSTVTLADLINNVNTESGPSEVIDNVFAAVLSHLGQVVIGPGKNGNADFSVTAGQYAGASHFPMAELDGFFEVDRPG